jgi:hypothetical protein
MKSIPAFRFGLLALALLFVAACTCVTIKSGLIRCEHYVAILPEANISAKDCADIRSVLKRFDKHLYRIQSFKNGKLVGSVGMLDGECMREGLVAEVAKQAKETRFTGCALQAGVKGTSSTNKGTSSTKGMPSSTCRNLIDKGTDLVASLKPILDRYNKK